MDEIVLQTELTGLGAPKRGKVRDIYDLGEHLLIIATDRVSAFDVVLPTAIPDKGKVLTQLSLFWFREMEEIVRNHVVEWRVERFPESLRKFDKVLAGRSMIVKKAAPVPVECVVRGYLAGSGWSEYKEKGSVCGIGLERGFQESSKLKEPIFTPTTKAEEGHDEAVSFDQVETLVGKELAAELREKSLQVYKKACAIAEGRGIIIADTKFEFGGSQDGVIIIDEVLTPDSSRFWSVRDYKPGSGQASYDKQIIRDYLNTLPWTKTYPGPELPPAIAEKARARYVEILEILTGRGLE
jgi:phosphoribosylaminoimidazole-succinocarboxamide synthase